MKIKVLHVIKDLSKAGAERICLDICNELHRRDDFEVLLVSMSEINEYPFLTQNIPFKVIKSKVRPSISGKSVIETREFVDIVNEFHPHIIHSHLFRAELLTREVPFKGVKYITHCHDKMRELAPFSGRTMFSKAQFVFFYERLWMLKRYRKLDNTFLCISEDLEQYYQSVLPKPLRKTKVLHNAVNVARFSEGGREREKDNSELKLINIGSFVAKKNQQFLIDIVNYLVRVELLPVTLYLLGEGETKQSVMDKVRKMNLEQHVVFAGKVDRVEDFLREGYIYVHAAYIEDFGLVLVEAMAAGLPVICLDGGGNRELIVEGQNGYIFSEQNVEKFAEKITELWFDREKYRQMSEYASSFSKKYDIKAYVDSLIDIYKTLLIKN